MFALLFVTISLTIFTTRPIYVNAHDIHRPTITSFKRKTPLNSIGAEFSP